MSGLINSTTYLFFTIAGYLIFAVPLYVIATRTDTANPWMAFVPILNIVLMLDIAGMDWWYIFPMAIPCVGFAILIWVWWEICEARGKPGALSLLLLVPIADVIMPFYVAFVD